MKVHRLLLWTLMNMAGAAYADQFHYHNFLIGDRAIGIGGAYTAISDDASGVFYNPAGLAYALNNDISGSANAIYGRKVIYKEAIASQDFKEESSGSVPSFFGGLQKLDNILNGLVFAFGIYTDNSELKDQNDLIEDKNLGVPSPCSNGKTRNPFILERYHRTSNQRSTTLNIAGGFGYRILPRLAVGVGLNYMNVDELIQEYQDVRQQANACNDSGVSVDYTAVRAQNIRQRLEAYGLQPVLSMQAVITERLSWGLTLKVGQYVSQSLDNSSEARNMQAGDTDQKAIDAASAQNKSAVTSGTAISQINDHVKSQKPLGEPALEIRTGLAYFHSTRLLLSADVNYHGAVSNAEDMDTLGKAYEKQAVIDYAVGGEYYITPSVPIRLGWFTNYDARPKLVAGQQGQRDHIDYNGESIFLAWVQPNSQIGAGFIFQQGWGEAQKIGSSAVIQKVSASSYTFAFSATHSL